MTYFEITILTISTISGVAYLFLGLAASSHLKNTSESISNRVVGSMFYWSLEPSQYDSDGAKLCVWGNIALVFGVISIFGWWFILKR
jgi:hypothetical protein